MKFLVSVTGHLGWKFSDYMLVLCQKLHIWAYDRQNFSSDQPPFRDRCAPPPKVEMLEPPMHSFLSLWQHSTSSDGSAQSLPPLDVPKELWRLVDYIFMNGLNEVSFSLLFCKSHAIIYFMNLLIFYNLGYFKLFVIGRLLIFGNPAQ